MLIIFSGLPGTGKSTVSRKLAAKLNAVYLRIDTIEQAIKHAIGSDHNIGPEGYTVAYAVARHNLKIGSIVVADSVNSIEITRSSWRDVAVSLGKPYIEIEVVCTDQKLHRQRVESRKVEVPELRHPAWQDILNRDYELWNSKDLTMVPQQ